jgi:hypothetical protein
MAFYTDMRDNVVAPLIREYGVAATLRQVMVTYDPTTGVGSNSNTDTEIRLVKLPIERPKLRNFFRDDLIERASYLFLVSAKEIAEASITPTANDKIILNGTTHAIVAVNEVAPGETCVLYKIMVEG